MGVTVQVGRTGRITPVAEITPTKLGGSTIRRATLHNQEYIDELELAIGDTVSISKRGDVIPAVERVIDKNEDGNTTFRIPDVCPCCGTRLEHIGALDFCPNYGCPDQVRGRIAFFASSDQMDIESLGPKTVDILYKAGMLGSIEDIYRMDPAAAAGLPGFGEKSAELLAKGIEESRDRPFATVLSSLGIAELGKKNAGILVNGGFDSFDKLLESAEKGDASGFASLPGFGDVMAENVINAFRDPHIIAVIDALRDAGLHVSAEMDEKKDEEEQIFSGQVWCATGSFENFNPRSKALAEIEARGGRTVSSVTSKTTHLLAGKGGGSKRAEAERLGVKIVNEDEFMSLLGKANEAVSSDDNGQLSLF